MADPKPKALRTMKDDPFAGLDLAWLNVNVPTTKEDAALETQPVLLSEEEALNWLLQQVAGPASASSPAGVPTPPGVDEE